MSSLTSHDPWSIVPPGIYQCQVMNLIVKCMSGIVLPYMWSFRLVVNGGKFHGKFIGRDSIYFNDGIESDRFRARHILKTSRVLFPIDAKDFESAAQEFEDSLVELRCAVFADSYRPKYGCHQRYRYTMSDEIYYSIDS